MSEEDLSIIVEDKATGAYMESAISYDDGKNNATWLGAMKSALVLTIISGNDDTKQADLVNDDVTKKIQYTSDGFTAECYWKAYQFGMTLSVSLTEEGLTASIADDSIKEDGDRYQIGTISIYPYLGHSYLDSKEGYLFIPDGNGALIYLNDKEGRFATGYSSMIYGTDIGFKDLQVISLLWDKYDMINDGEQIIAPVYGIAHTDDKIAYLAVVEEGEKRATIEAHPNGASVDYNRAYAKFIERRTYTQPTSNNSTEGSLQVVETERTHTNLKLRYLFLSGDKANYAGMANAYRDYLLGTGELTKKDTSYKTRVDFLGTERESWVVGTKAVVMTTVDDIDEIYTDLGSAGVVDLVSVYKGWQKGGLYNLPITAYSADKKIGGTRDLTALIKKYEGKGINLYLYNDALTINPDEKNATFNVANQVNKRRYSIDTYQDVYETFYDLVPTKSSSNLTSFIKKYTKKGVDNLCIAGISNSMFSYYYRNNTYNRYDCAEKYLNSLDTVAGKTDLVLEQPFVYLWHDTNAFMDMPLYTSNFIFEDESVPFLSIVLKGVMPVYAEYVNFEANREEFFLKMVETGTYPSFYITKEDAANLIYTNSSDIYSSEYSVYRDTIISYTEQLKELNSVVEGAVIVSHDIGDNGVTVVGYDNGVKVYVNYSEASQTVDGVTIDAMSYEVVK